MKLTHVAVSRPLARTATVCLLTAAVTAPTVLAATAHPLGNFTVNHHTGLRLAPDRVHARLVVDRAEISTAQELPHVDRDGDGTVDTAEAAVHARAECAHTAPGLRVKVDGKQLGWTAEGGEFTTAAGEGGLRTSRLVCELSAPAALDHPASLTVHTAYDTRRIGWQEITARGDGVTLKASDVPARSATDELRAYPADPLASPLDQRTATLSTEPGRTTDALAPAAPLAGAGPVTAALTKVSGVFDSLVGRHELTLSVGTLALVLAIVLGAAHAVLPGHGKTLMAAYLAGRRGTPRDAVTVGATVTVTHTAGVLLLGLFLPLVTSLAGEVVLTWLGVASGLLITGIGCRLLWTAVRTGELGGHGHTHTHPHGPAHDHGHGPAHDHHHGHAHDHPHGPAHDHDDDLDHDHKEAHGHGHPHSAPEPLTHGSPDTVLTKPRPVTAHVHPPLTPVRRSRAGLVGMGIAGGLVPSPSALVVLLGSVALGRTAFGVLLVVGYGLGMAATLTLAGLLLVRVRDRLDRHMPVRAALRGTALRRLARTGPVLTSGLVLVVGLGLVFRAAAGPW